MATKSGFGHVMTFGRNNSANAKRATWTVKDIIAEAKRDPEASPHVEKPQPPVHVAGFSLDELEQRIEQYLDENKNTVIRADGSTLERKARADAHVLAGAVYSWPEHVDYFDKERFEQFKADTLAFHEKEFGRVDSAVVHLDESFPHLHVYTMSSDAKKELHPGHQAKNEAKAAGADAKAANKAYRDAMKSFQDRYFDQVSSKNGMDRLGPGRQRIPRKEWREMKQERVNRSDRIRTAEDKLKATEGKAEREMAKLETVKKYVAKGERLINQHVEKLTPLRLEYSELTKKVDKLKKTVKKADAAVNQSRDQLKRLRSENQKYAGFMNKVRSAVSSAFSMETEAEKAQREAFKARERELLQEVARRDEYVQKARDQASVAESRKSRLERENGYFKDMNEKQKLDLEKANKEIAKLSRSNDKPEPVKTPRLER